MNRLPAVAVLVAMLVSMACDGDGLPRELRARRQNAATLAERGMLRRATEELEAIRDTAPDDLETRAALARLYAEQSRFDQAEAEIAFVLDRDRDFAPAYAARGRSLCLQRRDSDARRTLEDAAAKYPDSDDVLGELGTLYARSGDGALALSTFDRLRGPRETLPYQVLLHWALAQEGAGRADEARVTYRAAIDRAPERGAEVFLSLGLLLLREGEREEGLELIHEALRRQPGEPEVLHRAGAALLAAGRPDEARNVLQRAVHATPPGSRERAECEALVDRAESLLPATVAPAGAPNIVVVVIDTLRRDHVGAYGYARRTTPVLDRLAREGVVVDDAVSQAPWTAASIATMFTGLYPSAHGLDGGVRWGGPRGSAGGALRFAVQKALSPSQVTLAEVLRRNGYRTAGFVSNTYVNSIFGLAHGFETYHDEHGDYSGRVGGKRLGAETNRLVFEWLKTAPAEPFFLFVHYNDPHLPYDPPSPHGREWVDGYRGRLNPQLSGAAAERHGAPVKDLSAEDLAYLVGLYDGEILYADAQVGRLLERLRSRRLARPTLTVVTSDHGEEFLEHGSMSHGYTLYEEQIRVPLIFHLPGRLAARREAGPFGLIDLAPTIVGLAGLDDALPRAQGIDRIELLRGPGDAAAWTFSEATYAKPRQALRQPRGLKLIFALDEKEELLFDLGADPAESRPLASHSGAAAGRQALLDWSAANVTLFDELHQGKPGDEIVLDEETEERLRSLGYIR